MTHEFRKSSTVKLSFKDETQKYMGLNHQGKQYIAIEGLEARYINISGVAGQWAPYVIGFYIHPNPGFGCGVSNILSGMSYLLSLGDMWNDDDFREGFWRALYGFRPGQRLDRYDIPNSSHIMCVADHQLNLPGAKETLAAWTKHFICHRAGEFPNWNHSPDTGMNFIVLNVNPDIKAREADQRSALSSKMENHHASKKPVQEVIPVGNVIRVARDSLGRFRRAG